MSLFVDVKLIAFIYPWRPNSIVTKWLLSNKVYQSLWVDNSFWLGAILQTILPIYYLNSSVRVGWWHRGVTPWDPQCLTSLISWMAEIQFRLCFGSMSWWNMKFRLDIPISDIRAFLSSGSSINKRRKAVAARKLVKSIILIYLSHFSCFQYVLKLWTFTNLRKNLVLIFPKIRK